MVAGNGDDLTGITLVGAIEALTVMRLLARSVDDVAEMKHEGRVQSAGVRLEVGRHVCGDVLGVGGMIDAAVTQRMKPDFSKLLDFACALGTDDVRQRHA